MISFVEKNVIYIYINIWDMRIAISTSWVLTLRIVSDPARAVNFGIEMRVYLWHSVEELVPLILIVRKCKRLRQSLPASDDLTIFLFYFIECIFEQTVDYQNLKPFFLNSCLSSACISASNLSCFSCSFCFSASDFSAKAIARLD